MKELLKIFTDLKNDSSRTGKEAILKSNSDNKLFREVLKFVYNPYIVTGISTKKLNKKMDKKVEERLVEMGNFSIENIVKDVIAYLKENNSGKDSDIAYLQAVISKLETEEERSLLKQIVTKDLKVGITSKTINKVYGKTIPEFSVMLAESYEKKVDKVEGKFYITQKLDGNRCVAIVKNNEVKFFSRKGQPIEGMVELESQFKNLPSEMVYDGELLLKNNSDKSSDELFRATQKVVRKDGEKKDLEFYVFDALPINEFVIGKSKKTYEQRRNSLELIFNNFKETQLIHLLPVLYSGNDKNMIAVLMKYAEEKGWEGLMVNTANGLYQTKRVADLLKVKKMKTADLIVVSFDKAIDGQFKDMLARINVEYKGSLVGVGSGFTIEERKYFTKNPDDIIGKIVEVQYFEESTDEKTGKPSLRFPVFKGVRHDKGVEDVRYE